MNCMYIICENSDSEMPTVPASIGRQTRRSWWQKEYTLEFRWEDVTCWGHLCTLILSTSLSPQLPCYEVAEPERAPLPAFIVGIRPSRWELSLHAITSGWHILLASQILASCLSLIVMIQIILKTKIEDLGCCLKDRFKGALGIFKKLK